MVKQMVKQPVLVAVMGTTGAGKSSFVELVTGENVPIGHSLESMTLDITPYSFKHEGRTYTVVDTPGFDDSRVSDKEILANLLTWLNENYDKNRKLNGILYLHRIDAPKMQGSALRNFMMFKQLCGEDFYGNLCLGTTCWGLLKDDIATGERRESDLRDKGGFWHSMIAKDARFVRIPDDQKSAREIVFGFAAKMPAFLKSQNEMGRDGLSIDQVSAAKALENQELQRVKAQHEKERELEKEKLEKKQREQEAAQIAKHERETREREAKLRAQEKERKRLEKHERDREAQRQRGMEALEEKLRQTRLEEEGRREREKQRRIQLEREQEAERQQEMRAAEQRLREERQRGLDNAQFALDFQKLFYAKKRGEIIPMMFHASVSGIGSSPSICFNCFRFLENESFRCEPIFAPDIICFECDYIVDSCVLCRECWPKAHAYCPGHRGPLVEMEHKVYDIGYHGDKCIGEIFCIRCSNTIGPLALYCLKDEYYTCPDCVSQGRECCSGEIHWVHRIRRRAPSIIPPRTKPPSLAGTIFGPKFGRRYNPQRWM